MTVARGRCMTGWSIAGPVAPGALDPGVPRTDARGIGDASVTGLIFAARPGGDRMKRAESREPRAESREPRAESREPRAESREPRAESREPRAELCLPGRVIPRLSGCRSARPPEPPAAPGASGPPSPIDRPTRRLRRSGSGVSSAWRFPAHRQAAWAGDDLPASANTVEFTASFGFEEISRDFQIRAVTGRACSSSGCGSARRWRRGGRWCGARSG